MRQTEHRSSLFLLEMMINLFLFAICAAVCVGLLLHARSMSMNSRDLTDAVYLAQTAAEEWQVGAPSRAGSFGDLTAHLEEHDGQADIRIYKADDLIYSLEGVRRIE